MLARRQWLFGRTRAFRMTLADATRRAAGVAALALTVACHSYRPTSRIEPPGELSRGDKVRVRYPEPRRVDAVSEVGSTVGVDGVRMVEGLPVGARGDTLRLRVSRFYTSHWFTHPERVELSIAPGTEAVLERKRFDGGRTALLALGITAILVGGSFVLFATDSDPYGY